MAKSEYDDAEKKRAVQAWKEEGIHYATKEWGVTDVTIYKWNKDLGIFPSGRKTKKKVQKRKYKKRKSPEMIEITADDSSGAEIVLTIPNLKIRAKNVEVINE